MKKQNLRLTLKKEVIAKLNKSQSSNVVGGQAIPTASCVCGYNPTKDATSVMDTGTGATANYCDPFATYQQIGACYHSDKDIQSCHCTQDSGNIHCQAGCVDGGSFPC